MESYYDIPTLTADQRFIDSMWLIRQYSLLPFMTLRQFFYARVVLKFYHTMTSRGVPNPLEIRFSIDGRPRVLRATDITAALGLPVVLVNSTDYRRWPQPSQREMVRYLARDTRAGRILFRRQLSPQMLLVDHVLCTSLFPLQHYVQRRGAILEALYRISEGFWFSPSELVMTSLLHFEEKVHRKDLAQAETFLLLMSRLLSQVLEHLGFPHEPHIERICYGPRASCCYGCCMRICYYTGIVKPADGPSRGHSHAESCHASSDHEPPRSSTSQCDRAYTAYSRSVRSRSLLGYACSRCSSFRSTGVYTTTRVRWSHSFLYISDPYPVETCLYFGWGGKLELEVYSITFCLVFSFINCLLILYRIVQDACINR